MTCCVSIRRPSACLKTKGVVTDAATGFSVVDVLAANPPIKNIEVISITDDAASDPFEGARLTLTAQDVQR